MVDFNLEGVEDGQVEYKFGSHAEEELAMSRNIDCESGGRVTENVPGCCRSLAHPQ